MNNGTTDSNFGSSSIGNGSVIAMQVQNGGTLSVEHSVGSLTLDGGNLGPSAASLTLEAGSTFVFEFNNATGAGAAERINLRIDSLTLLDNVHGTTSATWN